jgi:hypothetical protein
VDPPSDDEEKNEALSEDSKLAASGRRVDLTVHYSVPYSTGDYFITGPTKIIYNSLGTLDNSKKYNAESYKIFNR